MTQKAISHSFGVAQPTVQKILAETVRAIFKALKAEYIGTPSEERWQTNAQMFEQRWNFPNCIGAIDGKHVVIQVHMLSD